MGCAGCKQRRWAHVLLLTWAEGLQRACARGGMCDAPTLSPPAAQQAWAGALPCPGLGLALAIAP